jgi:hypothetical protein
MSTANETLVRSAYAAYEQGDVTALLGTVDPTQLGVDLSRSERSEPRTADLPRSRRAGDRPSAAAEAGFECAARRAHRQRCPGHGDGSYPRRRGPDHRDQLPDRVGRVDPGHDLWIGDALDIQIDDDWILTAANHHALERLVVEGIDLLMGQERRNENE